MQVATLGEKLKRQRELRNITIEEISEATKIQMRFLRALEEDNFEDLPAEAFIKGFIQAYCEFIGINGRDMVNKYLLQIREEEEREEVESPEKGKNIGYILPVFIFSILILLGGLFTGFYYTAKESGKEKHTTGGKNKVKKSKKAVVPPSGETKKQHSEEPHGPTGGSEKAVSGNPAVPTGEKKDTLELAVRSDAKSWIKISKKDEVLINRILEGGEKRNFEIAKQELRLSVGNAGGVSVKINGKEIPPLGSSGEVVRNIIVSKDTLGELTKQKETKRAGDQ